MKVFVRLAALLCIFGVSSVCQASAIRCDLQVFQTSEKSVLRLQFNSTRRLSVSDEHFRAQGIKVKISEIKANKRLRREKIRSTKTIRASYIANVYLDPAASHAGKTLAIFASPGSAQSSSKSSTGCQIALGF
jgi:hypothetical protein